MLNRKQQVKRETRVDKIAVKSGRLKSTELTTHSRVKHITGAS